jgi:hypothetical protein
VQIALEASDVSQPVVPEVGRDQLRGEFLLLKQGIMDTDYEDLLVVGAVEDADAATLGQVFDAPPEIIVVEFFSRWALERHHLAALRVDAGHHMLDSAILARRVHGLEDEEDRPAVLGVEPVLQLCERLYPSLHALLGPGLVLRLQPGGILGIGILKTKGVALGNAIGLRERACLGDDLIEWHEVSLLSGRLVMGELRCPHDPTLV